MLSQAILAVCEAAVSPRPVAVARMVCPLCLAAWADGSVRWHHVWCPTVALGVAIAAHLGDDS